MSSWKLDFLKAGAIVIVGAIVGFIWNPSSLRPAKIKIDPSAQNAAYLEEVSVEEVLTGLESGEIIVVDSRQRSFYEKGHIRGSLPAWDNRTQFLMPFLIRLIPRDTALVVVDEKVEGYGGRRIAGLFAQRGYANVRLMSGGLEEWRRNDHPMVEGWDFDAIKEWGGAK